MKTSSVAAQIREHVLATDSGTFLRRSDFSGSDRAVESALSRLVAASELVRVRKGTYWRGEHTRFGMTSPSKLDVALQIGGKGSGPAGISAARFLGLTTQVPSIVEVAVPGKTPDPLDGVRFRKRPFERRERDLRPIEVAFLEILREPDSSEHSWPATVQHLRTLLAGGTARQELLHDEIADEAQIAPRERWRTIVATA